MSLAEGVMGDICLRHSIHSCGECACQATDSRSTHQRVGQPTVFFRDTKFSHSNLKIRLMFTNKTWYFSTSHLHLRRSVSSPGFFSWVSGWEKIHPSSHHVVTLWVFNLRFWDPMRGKGCQITSLTSSLAVSNYPERTVSEEGMLWKKGWLEWCFICR